MDGSGVGSDCGAQLLDLLRFVDLVREPIRPFGERSDWREQIRDLRARPMSTRRR